MNVYIFNQIGYEGRLGIASYVHQLAIALKDRDDVHICVVNLMSEKPQIRIERIDQVEYWYFPLAISGKWMMGSQEQRELYERNVIYLLRLYIKDKKDLIFHLMFPANDQFAQGLRNAFDCSIVTVFDLNSLRDVTGILNIYESCLRNKEGKIKTLIVTGQSNHDWQISHLAIKQILENSGLFMVNVAISPKAEEIMSNFNLDFASHQLIVLDYDGNRWPEETEKAFLSFVENGGGVVVYHAANNAFKDWKEYNRIIGFGGWGGRDETAGPYIYQQDGCLVYDEESSGCVGSHGCRHEFVLHCGNPEHPVTKGLPAAWRHAQDELYDRMRGPGIVKDVLFWGYSDPTTKGSGRDELAMFTVDYGEARIFHTTLGHAGNSLDDNVAMQCAGFQVTLLRGAEWAATGKVTQPVPNDFPTEATVSLRKNYK
ncbi:ThuA domain-containing protein [uncultured Parabacteroides sp.]|uniref:ThuA domain-containing protein n=1 Tax=uncultured Parabacteroides sp. TaxID=512312 RepID=UPI00262B946E|nr:ThuA domain-containing protein [uncultured Parabacteroides sp.]